MADIELVIKIPKRIYNYIRKYEHIANSDVSDIKDAIINSTPLPKGHGKLIDVKDLLEEICLEDTKENRKLNLGEIITLEDIDRIEPIIEADKESK